MIQARFILFSSVQLTESPRSPRSQLGWASTSTPASLDPPSAPIRSSSEPSVIKSFSEQSYEGESCTEEHSYYAMTIQGDITVEIHSVALLLIFKDDIAKLSLHYYCCTITIQGDILLLYCYAKAYSERLCESNSFDFFMKELSLR